MTRQTTRRGFLKGLAGLGAAGTLRGEASGSASAVFGRASAAPALVAPERRLWALDRTMVARPATVMVIGSGAPLVSGGPGWLYIDGEPLAEIVEWHLVAGAVAPLTLRWLQQYERVG